MPGVLELCVKYFDSKDLYSVLGVSRFATEKEIKKAYHKKSLLVHPDRVKEDEKLEATEKFKVLGKVHAILSDVHKKAAYDDTGCVDDDDEVSERNWEEYWRLLFKPITEEDIRNYEKTYKGSDTERLDLKKAYVGGEGDMDIIMSRTPFANTEDEPRLREIIQEMIDSKEISSYKIFTHEPSQKTKRRHRKAEKEAREVENLNRMREIEKEDEAKENDLAVMIRQKQQERGMQMDSFFDKLAAKYGGGGSKEKTPTKRRSERNAAAKNESTTTGRKRKRE